MTKIVELNELMKKYTQELSDALQRKDLDSAISREIALLEALIAVAKNEIISVINDPTVKNIAESYVLSHEKTLSYARGVLEGLRYVSPIYALGEKEQIVHLLASSVSELFSFIMGALLIVASLSPPQQEPFGVV
ncbi:hypothetical protein [Thermofilum pendens]|nr:hypothetical protein [Thermofilum pendens]